MPVQVHLVFPLEEPAWSWGGTGVANAYGTMAWECTQEGEHWAQSSVSSLLLAKTYQETKLLVFIKKQCDR